MVGLGLYCLRRIFRVWGSFRQVSYYCGFLKSRGRLIVGHPDFHLTSRRLFSASSGHSETSSMLPSSMVSGGSGCVSGSHSRSTGVGLGGDVQRTPSGKVRQRSKSQMRRLEDGRSEEQGGGAGSGSTAHRPLAETDWSVGFVFDSEDTNSQLVLLPPKPPSPLRTIAQVAVEPTTTTTVAPKGKIKELTSSGRKSHPHFFWLPLYRRSTCIRNRLEHSCLRFRRYPHRLYRFLRWRRRERQSTPLWTSSPSLFSTPTGSPFLRASPNKLAVGVAGHSPGNQSMSVIGKGDSDWCRWQPWAWWGESCGWEWEWWRWRCEWN